MKKILPAFNLILLIFASSFTTFAQIEYGAGDTAYDYVKWKRNAANSFRQRTKNKDFQINVREFVGGKLTKTDLVFNSKQDEYFKIKNDKFSFRVLSRRTSKNTVSLEFQFNGFRQTKEYKIAADQKEFALKDFVGPKPEISISMNTSTYILTYMMPYVLKNGSTEYCDVVQSDIKPEELGIKYAIPRYYLIDIKFQ